MKKQIKFVDGDNAYRFELDDDDKTAFEIEKATLIFHTGKFYECFFKGLHEKPTYLLLPPENKIKGQAKHVYDTVKAIFASTCNSINDDWFSKPDEKTDSATIEDPNIQSF